MASFVLIVHLPQIYKNEIPADFKVFIKPLSILVPDGTIVHQMCVCVSEALESG